MRASSSHILAIAVAVGLATQAHAGPVFLTGHDPDFHAQDSSGAVNLLRTALSFVTNGTYNDSNPATKKFLWVESAIPIPGGHRRGVDTLNGLGLGSTQFDTVTAAQLGSVIFGDYSAIGVASSFGGTLTRAELDGLIARSADIAAFVNGGGGLFASAECFPCGANLLDGATAPDLFGFVPVPVTSIGASPPFFVTPIGSAGPFNLTNGDLNDPTHNSFGDVGGLLILDTDEAGHAVTLAGNVGIRDGEFVPGVPEPGTLALLGASLLGLGALRRRLRR